MDARQILSREGGYVSGDVGGFCLYYTIVFAQACQSFGIPARIATINYSVWGGHEVVEIWSRDYNKWIMIDPQFDSMFVSRKIGEPINVLELHHIFLDTYYPGGEVVDRDTWTIEDRNRRSHAVDPENIPIRLEIGGNALSGRLGNDYIWWKVTEDAPAPGYAGGYGFFNTAYVRWLPRSNWLSKPLPMPVTHGRTHWGWDGYLAWAGPQTPETTEHRHYFRKESDLYGQLFTVDCQAEATGKEGTLVVNMATDSPAFDHYELTVNDRKVNKKESGYRWELAPGINTLTVQTVDVMGNKGPNSELTVNYMPV